MSSPELTHDDVNRAFGPDGDALTAPDDRLFGLLMILCSAQIRSDENRLLANNRAITINAILMRRFMDRANRDTTRLTCVVIFLAVLNVIVPIWLALR